MIKIPPQLITHWQDFRRNRRLQFGILAILSIVAAEGSMRWLDHLGQREVLLDELRNKKLALQGQSRDEVGLSRLLQQYKSARQTAETRMWVVPSEAVGQAQQKDWLQAVFKECEVVPRSITLASPRSYAKAEVTGGVSPASVPQEKKEPETKGVREFRATVLFPFTPVGLEKVLSALEGGEPFVQIETLNANRRERRTELTLRMLMDVDKERALQRAKARVESPQIDNEAVEVATMKKAITPRENTVVAPASNKGN